MVNKKRRIRQITIETHSITIIKTQNESFSAHCEHCHKTVTAFVPEQFAGFFQLTLAEVYRRVENGELHLAEKYGDVALVCGGSSGNSADK